MSNISIKDDFNKVIKAGSESVILFLVPNSIFTFIIFLMKSFGYAEVFPNFIVYLTLLAKAMLGLMCGSIGYRTGQLKGFSHTVNIGLMLIALISSGSLILKGGAIVYKLGNLLTAIIITQISIYILPIVEKSLKSYGGLFTIGVSIPFLCAIGIYINGYSNALNVHIGAFIKYCITLAPFTMGGLISMVFFVAVCSPISSVALGIIVGISGIAAGSATVGVSMAALCMGMIAGYANGYFKYVMNMFIAGPKTLMPLIFSNTKILLVPLIFSFFVGGLSALSGMQQTTFGSGFGCIATVGFIEAFKAGSSQFNVITFMVVLPLLSGFISNIISLKLKIYKKEDLIVK